MLGSTFQFSERRDRLAAVHSLRVIDLEQECLVTLNDQGAVGHRVIVSGNVRVQRRQVAEGTAEEGIGSLEQE